MRIAPLGHSISGAALASFVLSACMTSGSLLSSTTAYQQGVLPHGRWISQHRDTSRDLLYTSSTAGDVYVYSYPDGKSVGKLTGFTGGAGLCVDSAGDVFVPSISNRSTGASTIFEYAHGGTQPIAQLSDTGSAFGCSIDPATGNLAVANGYDTTNPYDSRYGSVAIYTSAQGYPQLYYSASLGIMLCGYDDLGNLYLSVYNSNQQQVELARLAKGSGSIAAMNLNVGLYGNTGFSPTVQWDGKHLTVSSNKGFGSPLLLYRLKIRGNKAKVIGTTTLHSKKDHHVGQTWIQGGTIIGVALVKSANNVALWAYPGGGNPTGQIRRVLERSAGDLDGVVVSLGSSP